MNELINRIITARNYIGTMKLEGIEEARKLVSVFDYLTQAAQYANELAKAQEEAAQKAIEQEDSVQNEEESSHEDQ